MKFFQSYWFFILAALITLIGLLTGWYFFFLLIFPLGLFKSGGRKDDEKD